LIEKLKTENIHNNNVKLAFYRNPKVPPIFSIDKESGISEVFGVQHIKLYIFDNDVIISGANLSENYFLDRCDRYYLIK